MKVTKLLRVARNVTALERARAFYADILGFTAIAAVMDDAQLAHLLGVQRVWVLRMRRGAQEIELSQCFPPGAPYPEGAGANASCFQHIALLTGNIEAAYGQMRQANAAAISRAGPVRLPVSSGGVIAYKFRDPDGHPLEFLQFPASAGKPDSGFDHSAISVSAVEASIAFYAGMGVSLASRQVNRGAEQDALDGLEHIVADVVALHPPQQTPHVELLCYRTPKGQITDYAPADNCADRLVFGAEGGGLALRRDPDGHVVLLDGR